MGIAGHLWTIGPVLAARLAPPALAGARPWSLVVEDAAVGRVRLSGTLLEAGSGRRAAILLHGLGGSADSPYLVPLARELAAAGWTTLRLNLRGADRAGDDLYHAGLTVDLAPAAAAPPLAGAERLVVVGVSLGGHVGLRWATEAYDPRLAAVVAVCAPVDLDRGATALDSAALPIYRRHLLSGLNEVYAAVAARRPVPVPVERVLRARAIREWDGLVVAPRFGFTSAEDYYARASVAPRLDRLRPPALLIWSRGDPMVPWATVEPALAALPSGAQVVVSRRGGHVGFPAGVDFGLGAGSGLAAQVVAWIRATVA